MCGIDGHLTLGFLAFELGNNIITDTDEPRILYLDMVVTLKPAFQFFLETDVFQLSTIQEQVSLNTSVIHIYTTDSCGHFT